MAKHFNDLVMSHREYEVSMTQGTRQGPDGRKDLWVVLPAHNEEASIAQVIQRVRKSLNATVVVVDDSSTDRTRELAEAQGAVVLPIAVRLGAWVATQTGLHFALKRGCIAAVTMDADGQHDPEDIHPLLQPVLRGHADVVIGSCTERGSRARRLAWGLFRWLTGLGVRDLTSGFRVYNRRALEVVTSPKASLLDYQDIGVLLILQRHGLKIVEMPVRIRPRLHGHSRIFKNWGAVARYMAYSIMISISKHNRRPFADIMGCKTLCVRKERT